MPDKQQLFRSIPPVDGLLQEERFRALAQEWGETRLYHSVQQQLAKLREAISQGEISSLDALSPDAIFKRVHQDYDRDSALMLQPVINCTGISLHTNLGRSPLDRALMERVVDIGHAYSNLEYRLQEGRRGSRYDALEDQLKKLLSVEAAMVVNNNAAAVMLMLSALARGQEAIVSRGELVEIGGKFRVPDVMEESGATLREVGTTNKTRLEDYERAMGEGTACILKVHRSNFRLEGFQEEVSIRELVELAHAKHSLLLYDLGSGLIHPDPPAILRQEPTVQEAVAAGCDLITFSGDKLLGGPQAGLIVGRQDLIEKIKVHPLTRALRCDKLTLIALQETLRIYPDPERINREIPLFRMLSQTPEEQTAKCRELGRRLSTEELPTRIIETRGEVGGGSAPGLYFATPALAIEARAVDFSLHALEEALRRGKTPVISFIQNDQLIFDLRTVADEEFEPLLEAIREALVKVRSQKQSSVQKRKVDQA